MRLAQDNRSKISAEFSRLNSHWPSARERGPPSSTRRPSSAMRTWFCSSKDAALMLDSLEAGQRYASLLRLLAGQNGEKERRDPRRAKGKERLDLRSENRWSTDAASLRMMPPIRHHG